MAHRARTTDQVTAAARLKAELKRVSLTQAKIQDETGISQDRVSRFLREGSMNAPDLVRLLSVLVAHGVELDYVFSGVRRPVEVRAESRRLMDDLVELVSKLRKDVGPGPGGKGR